MNNIPKGYKQTEVGVIPEEWEVQSLGSRVDFLDGKRRPVNDSDRAKMRGDYPLVQLAFTVHGLDTGIHAGMTRFLALAEESC